VTIFILKHLHWGYWILFGCYLYAMIYRSIKVRTVYKAARSYGSTGMVSGEWRSFDILLQQVKETYRQGMVDAAENRIDEIWIQFRSQVSSHIEAVRGYVNALILWGFAGTLFGSFMALFQMGQVLTQSSVSARIAGTAGILRDALSLAMITSLVASVIAAIAITWLCVEIQSRWVTGVASILNDSIFKVYKSTPQVTDIKD